MKKLQFAALMMMLLVAGFVGSAVAQQPADTTLDYEINALRADLRADKADIVKEAMGLKPAEADAFWSVYKRYDAETAALNDQLVKLIKEYAAKFGNIKDPEAAALTQKALDIQGKRIDLKKKYFPEFAKATSATTAAKFYQVEHRLELLFNLKLASEIPGIWVQSEAAAAKKDQ
jgi:hypothetical protein